MRRSFDKFGEERRSSAETLHNHHPEIGPYLPRTLNIGRENPKKRKVDTNERDTESLSDRDRDLQHESKIESSIVSRLYK